MLLKVTDQQFNKYCSKMLDAIAETPKEQLKLLVPSIVIIQRQALSFNRTLMAMTILQEYTRKQGVKYVG